MSEFSEEFSFFKSIWLWVIAVMLVVSGIVWFFNKSDQVVTNGFADYHEFQEIYNTTTRINTDLGNLMDIPKTDVTFEQFSKAQRINTLKGQLNKWVEEYNAKSKMWDKSMWKSKELPYQLSVDQYSNYNKKYTN